MNNINKPLWRVHEDVREEDALQSFNTEITRMAIAKKKNKQATRGMIATIVVPVLGVIIFIISYL